jgi:hypothetical protein
MKINKKSSAPEKSNFVPNYAWPIGLIELDVLISITPTTVFVCPLLKVVVPVTLTFP